MYNYYYETLLRRVEILEQLYLEGARDDLKKYLGDDLFDDYMKIRNKISDTEWKDFGKIQKKDLSDIRDYVDNFQSKSDVKKQDKNKGAELIYSKDGWKVYKITTYKAAQLYGKGTKWCITGNHEDYAERGQELFDTYIKTRKLDDCYYFYIADDGDKYCVLKRKDGIIDSIWAANDNRISGADILKKRPDFPSVPGVLEFNEAKDEEKENILNKAAKKCQRDLKSYLNLYYDDSCVFGKTSIKDDVAKFSFSVKLFFSGAKIKGTISLVYKLPIAFDLKYSFIDSDKKLNNGKDISGTIKNVAVFEHSSEGEDEILYEDFYDALRDADDYLD